MNKFIQELAIPEENKILLSKIEKRISFLSEKTNSYFEYSIKINSKDIEKAYEVNEDLISILNAKNELVTELRNKSFQIREKHQVNFTKELRLNISEEVKNVPLIKNTIEKREELISADDKHLALGKVKKYIKKGTLKSKIEMEEAIDILEQRIKSEKILNIESMNLDIKLIKKFINPRRIGNKKYVYLFIILTSIFVTFLLFGGFLWVLSTII